jgi:nitrogen fixation protein FixH
MSFIRPEPPQRPPEPASRRRQERRTPWRWFPWWIIGSMLLVVAVNGGLIYFALSTFPGQAGHDGFDLSNHYDQVIAAAQRQAQLGWSVRVAVDAAAHPELVLTDHTGAPLSGAQLAASAERPLGPSEATTLQFQEVAQGHYVAVASLPEIGQWDLLLTVTAGGEHYSTTQRVVVR